MRFSFHRGSLALELVGTVGGRAAETPEERLPDAAALATWLAEAGLAADAAPTDDDLADARALREALYRAAAAALDGAPLRRADVATVNRAAAALRDGAPQLTAARGVRWDTARPVAFALARVAADGIDLLAHRADRLARCELPGCGALVLSRSRGERRRWCSMETCGNRAKVAAFRARARRGLAR